MDKCEVLEPLMLQEIDSLFVNLFKRNEILITPFSTASLAKDTDSELHQIWTNLPMCKPPIS